MTGKKKSQRRESYRQNYYDGQQAQKGNVRRKKDSGSRGYDARQGYDDPQYYGGPQGYEDPRYYGGPQGYDDPRGYDGPQGYYEDPQGYGPQGYYEDPQGYDGRQGYEDPRYYGGPQGYGDPRGYGGPQGYDDPRGYGGSQGYSDAKGRYPKKKKKHRKLKFALEVIVLILLGLGLFAFAQLGRIDRTKLKDILVNTGIKASGYRNIALFGVDSREGQLESGTNSDTIMIASINNRTGDVKLVSVYRDTYLDNTNGEYRKATECFAGGGAERAVNMLNKNLDLDIKDFVTVDFNAIIEAVDLLGGIELDITEEERQWLNGYLVETSQVTGVGYTEIESAGTQQVTGIQAMAYCRIRYTEGWDFKRTERQRTVLGKIFEKAKAKGVAGLLPMVTTMMEYISTSLSNTELLSLATQISRFNIGETTGFPFNQQAANISAGDCVVPVNLAANVTQLHEYLFGEQNYTPSQTVQEISNKIISDTGIQ